MDSESARGDEVYQPDGSEVQDDEGLLDAEDTLLTDAHGALQDPYDEGFSAPQTPLGVEHYGDTADEGERGETMEQLLAEEEPDVPVPDGADEDWGPGGEPLFEDTSEDTGEELSRVRSGHLVTAEDGPGGDELATNGTDEHEEAPNEEAEADEDEYEEPA